MTAATDRHGADRSRSLAGLHARGSIRPTRPTTCAPGITIPGAGHCTGRFTRQIHPRNSRLTTHYSASLPDDLPIPQDDGRANHLPGMELPAVELACTDGSTVDLASLEGCWVIYIYPMTGQPGVPLPEQWDEIPGARGCTPQSCSFRDHHAELKALGASVYGLSAQDPEAQREARERLRLPFQLLSDSDLKLKHALQLPTFEADGLELFKRLTIITRNGRIEKVFNPVFPPDRNADDVMEWLRKNGR
jgi:peroxiredoxin